MTSVAVLVAVAALLPARAQESQPSSGDAQWIWSPDYSKDHAASGAVFFRKEFSFSNVEGAKIQISCDDQYELFVNGRRVGSGRDWKRLDVYDVRSYLIDGINVIAVKGFNPEPGSAGLVARVVARRQGNTDESHSTDSSWLTSTEAVENWQFASFDASSWKPARVLGEFNKTAPWGEEVRATDSSTVGRFQVPPKFAVERVASPEDTGSLIAMAFNERGEIIASREGGPLLHLSDADGDGMLEKVTVFCDEVTSCQGILPLNGHIFAVGENSEGEAGFFRIVDEDRDGVGDEVTTLLKFTGGMGEHGPHAPILGPDGMIYLVVGNHSAVEVEYDAASPLRHYYEGDLVQPRYEDAGGHAHGIKAPGGVVIRTDVDATSVELFAGGFRNAYDIAFNRQGDLFTFDSDMEWDEGLPWFRPTRINHAIPGAEFGWRSGWAKWPAYYLDSLPSTIDTGRGSPTGVEFYNHHRYPLRYHNALFACDWSLGRILVVRMKPAAGTYAARADEFVRGRPLNVSDIAVGPDGWLYFSTGGRGTEGGIYRIVWNGEAPPEPRFTGITKAIRHPQLYSAWGRNEIAKIRRSLGEEWDEKIEAVALGVDNPTADRTRALDLMQLVGPFPGTDLLIRLAGDRDAQVRAKAAYLMGIHTSGAANERLVEMLDDVAPTVRRKACESLVRAKADLPVETLIEMLKDTNDFVAWAARRALEHVPTDEWQAAVLASDHPRIFVMGAAALLAISDDRATVDAILARISEMIDPGEFYIADPEFLDLLRVTQLALDVGDVKPEEVPRLRDQLAAEYPSLEKRMNRELIRLLVYLQVDSILPRLLEEIATEGNPMEERLHAAVHARFLESGWTAESKLELLFFYEKAGRLQGGLSLARYIDNFRRDFVATLSDAERSLVVQVGAEMPSAALQVLAELPEKVSPRDLARLAELDRQLGSIEGEAAAQLATGIVAVLARSGDADSMRYLREIYTKQPERRDNVAMGLAQAPDGENWSLLIQSLSFVEDAAAREVLGKLQGVARTPESGQDYRNAILCGLRLGEDGTAAIALLEKWTSESHSGKDVGWEEAFAGWQEWFAATYPDLPAAELPAEPEAARWSYQQILDFLSTQPNETVEKHRGLAVFEKAQCAKCHRFGDRGEGIGPDLTTVSQRFQQRELLQSVIYPSLVISDQYASKTVVTTGGLQYTGIVGQAGASAIVVLQENTQKQVIPKEAIEEVVPNSKSAMPAGLLDQLTLEEIADLFGYLSEPPIATQASLPR